MKRRKMIIAAVVLLLLLLTGGVLAYFTDTKSATNTFTLGNVKIELSEPAWDATKAEGIVPGVAIAKDPTIKNVGNNKAFVFAQVDVPCLGNKELFTYDVDTEWTILEDNSCDNGVAKKVYYYGTSGSLTEIAKNESTSALFSEVTLVNLTNDEATAVGTGNINMEVTGYGIQSEGLTSNAPADVFANFS